MLRLGYLLAIGGIVILMAGCSGGSPVEPYAEWGTILLKNTSDICVKLVLDGKVVKWDEDTELIVPAHDQYEFLIIPPEGADGYYQVWLVSVDGTRLTETTTCYLYPGLQLTLFYDGQ